MAVFHLSRLRDCSSRDYHSNYPRGVQMTAPGYAIHQVEEAIQ